MPAFTRLEAALMREHGITHRESDGRYGFNLLCARPGCPNTIEGYCFATDTLDEAIAAKKRDERCNMTCDNDCWLAWDQQWNHEAGDIADAFRAASVGSPAHTLFVRVAEQTLRIKNERAWKLERLSARIRARAERNYQRLPYGTPERKKARRKARRSLTYKLGTLILRTAYLIGYRRAHPDEVKLYLSLNAKSRTMWTEQDEVFEENCSLGGHRSFMRVLRERNPTLYREVQHWWTHEREADGGPQAESTGIESVPCEV